MPCFGPLTAYFSPEVNPSGKRSLVFRSKENEAFSFKSAIPIKLPCGKCIGCRLEYARKWGVRCMHETKSHTDCCFVTLTYDDDHLPVDGSVSKSELVGFVKRLHNRLLRSRGVGIRYYGCGEYGDQNDRPHYHAILFGYSFPDRRFFKDGKREGERYYTSDELEELWPFGLCVSTDVTFDTANYVAGYVVKKINGSIADDHYMGREREFGIMSQSIGRDYVARFSDELFVHDSIVVNGVETGLPRSYSIALERIDAMRFSVLKRKRRKCKTAVDKWNGSARRFYVRERVVKARLALNRRSL